MRFALLWCISKNLYLFLYLYIGLQKYKHLLKSQASSLSICAVIANSKIRKNR